MNQPIQENKERCQNCGMRIEDFRETGQFYCDEEGEQRHDFPSFQNTSREEIRFRFQDFMQDGGAEKAGIRLGSYFGHITDWWLAEIEAAEKRGYENRAMDWEKDYAEGSKSGRQSAFSQVLASLDENITLNNWSHSVGSHSDDRGGGSDIECDCMEKEQKFKIDALESLKKKIINLQESSK